jgi:hypothetical protein
MNYPFWDIPLSRLGLGDRHHRHLPRHDLAVCRGRRPLSAAGRAQGAARGRADWLAELAQLVGYSKFFLILTGVFGTISGVGIWFAIGLTHPEATSTLIHNFVFGWAIEWVFFMVELTTAMVYYYTWNKIDAKLHLVWAGSTRARRCARSSSSTAFSPSCSRRATPGLPWPAPATKPASSGTRSSIPPTGRACCCAPACALAGRHLGAHQRQPHRRRQAARAQVVAGQVEREVAGAFVRGHAVPVDLVSLHGSRSRSARCSRWASTPSAPAHFRPSRAWRC